MTQLRPRRFAIDMHAPDGAWVGTDGLFLCKGVPLIEHGGHAFVLRPADDIAALLMAAYGYCPPMQPFMQRLRRAGKRMARRDFAGAHSEAKRLGLRRLDASARQRLAKAGYDPNEPRDGDGRWTGDGGDSGATPAFLRPVSTRPIRVAQDNTVASDAAPEGARIARVPGLPPMASPVPDPQIRGDDGVRDDYGTGRYHDQRNEHGGQHLGVDLVAPPGTQVVSPVSGTVTGKFDPYGPGDPRHGQLSGVQIQTTDDQGRTYVVRLMYVDSTGLNVGDRVEAGVTPIGTAQDLSTVYPPTSPEYLGMTNHVHVDIQRGERYQRYHPELNLDPTPAVREWQRQ